MRRRTYLAALCALIVLGLYLHNASWRSRPTAARVTLLAHRGMHQSYDCGRLAADGCSAVCMVDPTHGLLENTIPSMRAAFELGADVVEIDVHPTTDGEFAVFHDWRLECRTNGTGVTRERSMAYLRSLDVGHGYTADGGKTFPFRGRGIGLMPTLSQVLEELPERRFLINIKSDDRSEGDLLSSFLLRRTKEQRDLLMVYGAEAPVERVLSLVPGLRGFTRSSIRTCATHYALTGWSGYVPEACRRSVLLVPEDLAPYGWGWPHRFVARMQEVETEVFVVGEVQHGWLTGIDTADDFARIRDDNFSGGVWTDRIEVIGSRGE